MKSNIVSLLKRPDLEIKDEDVKHIYSLSEACLSAESIDDIRTADTKDKIMKAISKSMDRHIKMGLSPKKALEEVMIEACLATD